MAAPDLCALVSARLCHDLVSPLGAIGNGLELLEMSGGGGKEAELNLISESLTNALGKLRFLRVAFGPAEADARHSIEEAASITSAAFQGRFSVTWAIADKSMPRPLAKALYLTILCLEKSLPLGGNVVVSGEGSEFLLDVEGRRTAPPKELWAHATHAAPMQQPLSADAVQFSLLQACLSDLGGSVVAQFSETGASLRLSAPAVELV